ncbi:MAG: BamA/TamA family outer membrane protein [Bacteroidales bacterium]|nr:BamA/TamA family outer membrane protein [Bacteroidales bacterium]
MTLSIKKIYVQIMICLLLASCSGTRHLPIGEKLYTGVKIRFESTEKIANKKKRQLKTTAKNAVRPEPNKKILGMRPQLWMYMAAGEKPESKFKKWLKKNGEAPVFLSSVKPAVTSAIIDAQLFNIGIFRSYTEFKKIEKKHTAKVIYTSHIHAPFKVKELIYAVSDDSISRIIITGMKKSLIKTGDDYSLENLKNERMRIDDLLKNNGYFYFNPDYLVFKADTSNINHDVTFRLTLKDSIPEKVLTVYRINNVFIDQDYSLEEDGTVKLKDTLRYQGNYFLGNESEMKIRPKVISRSVYLRKNEIYSRINHNITLNRLMTMGNFKFVRINFSDSDTSAAGFLDITILMTPMPQRTFRAELELVSKSNNYMGPRLNTSLLNRNAFKGAELLNISLAASFEAQFSGTNLFSYAFTPQVELYLPRFLVPFKIKSTNSLYIPKTRFSLSFTYTKRVGYFDMRTFQFIFGYRWKKDIRQEHELNPINISYTTLANKTDAFIELLATNPFLKKSYEEQFIAGGNYIYTYNEQVIPFKKMQYFFQLSTEAAGNVFSLAYLITGKKVSADNPSKVVGSVYSQYARLSIDGRGFYNFKDNNKFAVRFFTGVGVPFGNSSILPYTKQFFSGGPNSIRAFHINSVGPGTYNQHNDSIGFMQLGGDVKLEMNAEYRFTIYRFLKGALFADAGNTWLLKSNPSTPGGQFSWSGFYKEIAVGAGIGLRIDVSFFIIRFDLAMPLRKPWLENGQRWVINQIDFGSPAWRSENLILNVAIGYPF